MTRIGLLAAINDRDGGWVDALDLTELAADLRLDHTEYHMKKGLSSTDPAYLRRVKNLAVKRGLAIGPLTPDGMSFHHVEAERRQKAVAGAKRGLDVAAFLGAPMVRIGPPEDDDPEPERTWRDRIECFQDVADYAADRGVLVGVCNHGPARPRGEDIVRAMKDIDRDNTTVIMDTGQWWPNYNTGNGDFQPNEHAYGYMEQVAPYTSYVCAKIYEIASGKEEWVDYERVFNLLKSAGFNGGVSIFYKSVYAALDDYRKGVEMSARFLRGAAEKAGL